MVDLTPYERLLLDVLKKNPDGAHFPELMAVKVPARPVGKNQHNRLAVHMKNLRIKGYEIKTVKGKGYKIV